MGVAAADVCRGPSAGNTAAGSFLFLFGQKKAKTSVLFLQNLLLSEQEARVYEEHVKATRDHDRRCHVYVFQTQTVELQKRHGGACAGLWGWLGLQSVSYQNECIPTVMCYCYHVGGLAASDSTCAVLQAGVKNVNPVEPG